MNKKFNKFGIVKIKSYICSVKNFNFTPFLIEGSFLLLDYGVR